MEHLHYLRYLVRHKWFVFVAGTVTGVSLWRLFIHDWSKFLPSEWLPYAHYFYNPTLPESDPYGLRREKQEERFDRAWLHHQHFNPHHWQHWVLREDDGATKVLPMPEKYGREMVADWMGAGRGITGKWEADKWYEHNKLNIQLHPDTRVRVEALLLAACHRMRGES